MKKFAWNTYHQAYSTSEGISDSEGLEKFNQMKEGA